MAESALYFDGKKYMWDGQEYASKAEAAAKEKEYREKDFEVRQCSADDKLLLYTRRVVTEVVVEGQN